MIYTHKPSPDSLLYPTTATVLYTHYTPTTPPLQGTMDSTGGIVSIIKQVVSEGSVLNLLNYGLLTALNVLPGFLSFVSMR